MTPLPAAPAHESSHLSTTDLAHRMSPSDSTAQLLWSKKSDNPDY